MQVKVGDREFELIDEFANVLDLLIKRVTQDHPKFDSVLEVGGGEGEGKSNMSMIISAYVREKSGRKINLFFKPSSCLNYAKQTEGQILWLDESVLGLMSTDVQSREYKDFYRLLTTFRKKRHFLVFNLTKFWRFPSWLNDRALGMVHMFSNNGKDPGKFYYIKKRKLEKLWQRFTKDKKKTFRGLWSFRGRIPYLMDDCFDCLDIRIENVEHATIKDYEAEKDKAIASIGEEKAQKQDKYLVRLEDLRYKLTRIPKVLPVTSEQLANALGISSTRLREWAKLDLKPTFSLENEPFEADNQPFTLVTRSEQKLKPLSNARNLLLEPENDQIEPKNEPCTIVSSQKTPLNN